MPDAHMEKLGRLCYFSRTPQLQPRGCDSNAAVGGTEVALLLLSPPVPVVWARPPRSCPGMLEGAPAPGGLVAGPTAGPHVPPSPNSTWVTLDAILLLYLDRKGENRAVSMLLVPVS